MNAIGVEVSSDNCLELYALTQILAQLFLEYIINNKMECDKTDELNICVWLCLVTEEPFSHYENIFGSAQNKILDDELRIKWWD